MLLPDKVVLPSFKSMKTHIQVQTTHYRESYRVTKTNLSSFLTAQLIDPVEPIESCKSCEMSD